MRTLRIALLAISLLTASCGNNPADNGTPSGHGITIGASVQAASGTIGTAGGVISVATPGDSLDGFRLTVPPGAYPQTRTFTVSYAPITEKSFGYNDLILSPLIHVDNGGGYADSMMIVRIPVKIPSDRFAMAFYYNRSDGSLEGMPIIGMDSISLTVATRHFSEIVVISWLKTFLQSLVSVNSGFEPKRDDWQFPNRGSYIAPGGHCSGQSITAIWYYREQFLKRSMPRLYGYFDDWQHPLAEEADYRLSTGGWRTTPQIWEDDVRGYRFASIMQKEEQDLEIRESAYSYLMSGSNRGDNDWITALALRAALYVEKKPQRITVRHILGTGGYLGHAMVLYKIVGNDFYVADPNYPGNTTRTFSYDPGARRFIPYFSGSNAAEIEQGRGVSLEVFLYWGWSAINNTDIIAQRWEDLLNGTIGRDSFPEVTITAQWTVNGSTRVANLTDGGSLTVEAGSSDVVVRATQSDGTKCRLAGCAGFDASLSGPPDAPVVAEKLVFSLPKGRYPLGIYVVAERKIGNTLYYDPWLDFIWVDATFQ